MTGGGILIIHMHIWSWCHSIPPPCTQPHSEDTWGG